MDQRDQLVSELNQIVGVEVSVRMAVLITSRWPMVTHWFREVQRGNWRQFLQRRPFSYDCRLR
ncbi:hypothetical protein ACLK1X_06225 [Escherichia coli]